ncbi:MAG: hypothetical protein CVU57_00590 [Deltaproteobacteria bacterium HGW-Deltaproteobacteria-15]|nr:MAG: hypothetical protein CVU57_00590 [Deltaproteobacteria bacterium HGW-Deltaproteobacteria-15]
MRFLCVRKPTQANIFGQEFDLKPPDSRLENIQDILATDNFSASELMSKHPGILAAVSFDRDRCTHFPKVVNRVEDIDSPGRILVMRNGGIGDHVLFLPALPVFRDMFPLGSEIWLSTQKEKHPIFQGSKAIDRLLPLPLQLNILLEADYLVDLSERDDLEDFEKLHMTDYYLNFLGIDYTRVPNKAPRIDWDESRADQVQALFEGARKAHGEKPFVLLNWMASNALRLLPPQSLLFLVQEFPNICFVVALQKSLTNQTRQYLRKHGIDVLDVTPLMEDLTSYMTAIKLCDAVVSSDSAAYHLAEALGKPSLSLFGPIGSGLRVRYYTKALAIDASYEGETCSAPCGLNKAMTGCREAVALGKDFSPCLLSIEPADILKAFKRLLGSL